VQVVTQADIAALGQAVPDCADVRALCLLPFEPSVPTAQLADGSLLPWLEGFVSGLAEGLGDDARQV
jgi:hypothetical protein